MKNNRLFGIAAVIAAVALLIFALRSGPDWSENLSVESPVVVPTETPIDYIDGKPIYQRDSTETSELKPEATDFEVKVIFVVLDARTNQKIEGATLDIDIVLIDRIHEVRDFPSGQVFTVTGGSVIKYWTEPTGYQKPDDWSAIKIKINREEPFIVPIKLVPLSPQT